MGTLIRNLTYHPLLTIVFFGWPIAAAVVAKICAWLRRDMRVDFRGALYYSVATYFGIDAQEAHPERFKWLKLIHRLVGILAWAYITAVFIATIIP